MKRFKIDLHSLSVRIILSFIGLVLLTAIAVGVPSVWLITNQLERQAWAQVDQGSRAAQALYAANKNELINLATLTVQRPTLQDLLTQENTETVANYLRTLQEGAQLDMVAVCDADQQIIASTHPDVPAIVCRSNNSVGYFVSESGNLWLLASAPIELNGMLGQVIVGIQLDNAFVSQMQAQTGLEHNLLLNNQPVVSSLSGTQSERTVEFDADNDVQRSTFTLNNNQSFYTNSFALEPIWAGSRPDTPVADVALSVTDIATTRQNLIWTLIASIVLVAAMGSLLGIFLARQISRPLAQLTGVATAIGQNNLKSSPGTVETNVQEIALVAQALEKARDDLRRTLTELRQEKAWTDHLLEAITEGIVTLDHKGQITFFSPGAERIIGCTQNDVLQRQADTVFKTVETDKPFSGFIPTPGGRCTVNLKLADGRQITLAITGAELTPPETDDTEVALVFRDVTEAEAMHRMMGHFLANISHEFRTPLSALAASAELLLDQAADLTRTELRELLTSLHLGIVGLQTLVDNLLESASIEAGRFKVKTRPANLGNIIVETIRVMQPLLEKHGQRLVLDLPVDIPTVQADSRRTVQVLVNLLSNAIKYGPDDAEITINAVVSKEFVQVAVSDQGAGVAPQHRDDLFRRFVHLGSDDDESQYGVGLGLSVVKAIVEAQGGQVGVDDQPNQGITFWFTLPVAGEK